MALVSIVLSFTDWQGIGPLHFVGLQEYTYLFTSYPLFWPALSHNLLWLLFFVCFATPMGILLAVCLDRPLRGSRIYQSIFFTPVVLSLAVVGFIWELQYSPIAGNGFIDSVLVATGLVSASSAPDWLGDPSHQHLGGPGRGQLAPHRLHHGPVPGRPEERRSIAA